MKKIFGFILSIFICANVFAIEAKVVSVSGKVQVQKGAAWVDLKPGSVLAKGDLVQTGFKSEAQISIKSANQNSTLTIGQLSRITIEQLVEGADGDKSSVYVAAGSAKSEIKKTEDRRASYTVRGPVATASVRGTEFKVVNGFNSASVETDEGVVAAWTTPLAERKPMVSAAQKDAEDAKNIQVSYPRGSFTVSKGQSASVANQKSLTSSETAIIKATSIQGMTQTALESESEANFRDASHSNSARTSARFDITLGF